MFAAFLMDASASAEEENFDEVISAPTPALTVADNDPNLKLAVNSYRFRLSLDFGDQLGGPVRYNTRFPVEPKDPNPSSYYHTQAYAGISAEYALAKGAIQFGLLTRRDLAHRGFKDRVLTDFNGALWRVEELNFHSDAVTVGWVFGEMYREAWWKASLASVWDQAVLNTTLVNEATSEYSKITLIMRAVSLRAKVMVRVLGTGAMDFHIGPDCHLPIYSLMRKLDRQSIEGFASSRLELKNSAAIGLGGEFGVRF